MTARLGRSRREVLAMTVATLASLAGVQAAQAQAQARHARPPAGGRPPLAHTREIAPGLHVRRGVDEDASQANADAIANCGFVLGRDAIAVLDPGGSLEDGRRLRARLREVSPLPIRYVILSHAHPDHLFGAGAFVEDGPEFVAHQRLPGTLAARGDYYQQNLRKILGEERADPIVAPTRLIASPESIDLGARRLSLHPHAVAHSDCDLSVFDETTRTLWLGDLLFVRRVPSLDGRLSGWLAELAQCAKIDARRAVPGHGPVSVEWPLGARDLQRYLRVLQAETRTAFRGGLDLSEAVKTVGRSERKRWLLFDQYHGHNVTQAFKEVEWE